MRGSGYAIGEILIFLAIASIIGFLIGWIVFYRRPGKQDEQLSPSNPNHVRHLEGRAKSLETKMSRMQQQANALLERLERASTSAPEQTTDTTAAKIAPAAAAPAPGQQKPAAPEPGAEQAVEMAGKDDAPASAGTEGVDEYLTEADERIGRLEETLNQLSEKLAELEED